MAPRRATTVRPSARPATTEEMTEEQRRQHELRMVRPRHDDPDSPTTSTGNDLDRVARNELKTLTKDNAEWVAKHLAMAARLIDEDPSSRTSTSIRLPAAPAASRSCARPSRSPRTPPATSPWRCASCAPTGASRARTTRSPLMVDSERGVGRPDRALELGRRSTAPPCPTRVQVALAIAMSGARLDLGQPELALLELEIPQLDPNTAFSYSPDAVRGLRRGARGARPRRRSSRVACTARPAPLQRSVPRTARTTTRPSTSTRRSSSTRLRRRRGR